MRDCEGVQICSASLFFCSTCFFSFFFLSFFYFLFLFVLVTHNHASQQHTTNNNNTPEGRPAVMEGGANVGGVNNDVGEGGSPVVTDPSAESGGAAAAAAAGGGGEDDSPVLGGVVGDGTAPTQTFHSQNGTPFTVTVVPAKAGQQAKMSWIWQVMHEFSPAVAGKNVVCVESISRTVTCTGELSALTYVIPKGEGFHTPPCLDYNIRYYCTP